VQIRNYFLQLLLIKLPSKRRHHAAATNNALHHVFIIDGEAAGEVGLLIELFQPWSLVPAGGIRGMAIDTINIEDLASSGLLCIESQFNIGHLGGIFSAAGQQSGDYRHQKNGRYSTQVTIMSVSVAF
jgi:hypothetical protein